ncbi:MAG: hypothetical protein WC998_04765 [Candidatus Paceibacterota bacterium]|jgi:hypothetical protein
MTTNEIADMVLRDLCSKHFPIFLTTFAGRGLWESDVFGINKNGYMYEFEIKRSRSDFLADFRNKEHKHRLFKERNAIRIYDEWKDGKRTGNTYENIQIPNRFFFVCEEGLLLKNDIPEYAGLITIAPVMGLTERKNAPLLHRNKANAMIYERVASVLSQRILYGCSYYTFRQNKIREENESLISRR